MVTLTALKCSGTPTTVGSLVAATTVRVIAGGVGVVCAVAGAVTDAAMSSTTPKILKCMITSQRNRGHSSRHHRRGHKQVAGSDWCRLALARTFCANTAGVGRRSHHTLR